MEEHSLPDDPHQQPARSFSPMDTSDNPPNAKKANLDDSLKKRNGVSEENSSSPLIRIEAEILAPNPSSVGIVTEDLTVMQNCLNRCVKAVEAKVMELQNGIEDVERNIAGAYVESRFNQVCNFFFIL